MDFFVAILWLQFDPEIELGFVKLDIVFNQIDCYIRWGIVIYFEVSSSPISSFFFSSFLRFTSIKLPNNLS